MLDTGDRLLQQAAQGGYAVPAFNVDNLESILAVTDVAREFDAPMIVQTIPRTLRYGGVRTYVAMLGALDRGGKMAMHLDHGGDEDICRACIDAGYSSVMIDGSALAFEQNVALTARVVAYAHARGVAVEGELGTIGGKEETAASIGYTDPEQAEEFARRTGVDSLAIGVGTAHGVYRGEPHIALDRIETIAARISTPLVLHGASGLSDEVVRACVRAGIRKINFATELRQAFTRGLQEGLRACPDAFDPKQYLPYAIERIRQVVVAKTRLCLGR